MAAKITIAQAHSFQRFFITKKAKSAAHKAMPKGLV
jgi:hypothetical protein